MLSLRNLLNLKVGRVHRPEQKHADLTSLVTKSAAGSRFCYTQLDLGRSVRVQHVDSTCSSNRQGGGKSFERPQTADAPLRDLGKSLASDRSAEGGTHESSSRAATHSVSLYPTIAISVPHSV